MYIDDKIRKRDGKEYGYGRLKLNAMPALTKRGTAEGIDISRWAIKVANENGLRNCHVADIFRFNPHKKYDTITLLQNNLGMAGSVDRTRKMLRILSGLLKDDGRILLMRKKIDKDFPGLRSFFIDYI